MVFASFWLVTRRGEVGSSTISSGSTFLLFGSKTNGGSSPIGIHEWGSVDRTTRSTTAESDGMCLCARVGPSTGYERPISRTCPWSTHVPAPFGSEQMVSPVVHFSVAQANDIESGTVGRGEQIWAYSDNQRPNSGDGPDQKHHVL